MLPLVATKTLQSSEAYLEPGRTSTMELFLQWRFFIMFTKSFIVDVQMNSTCASGPSIYSTTGIISQ